MESITTKTKKEVHGSAISANGSEVEVHAIIDSPEKEDGTGTWVCAVRCPFLFAEDKYIVGVDADQAAELAEAFLRDLLDHHGVTLDEKP